MDDAHVHHTAPTNFFERLPDEIVLLIFEEFWRSQQQQLLSGKLRLKNIHDVCRQWKKLGTVSYYHYSTVIVDPGVIRLMDPINAQAAEIANVVVPRIQAHSRQLCIRERDFDMIIDQTSYDNVWSRVNELITGCGNAQSILPCSSVFPPQLSGISQAHPGAHIHIKSFACASFSSLPVSACCAFFGRLRKAALSQYLISQFRNARLHTLALHSRFYHLVLTMPMSLPLWDWSQVETMHLEVKSNFNRSNLQEHLRGARFDSLRRLCFKDMNGRRPESAFDNVAILGSIIENTQVEELEVCMRIQPGDLVLEIIKLGAHLRKLKLKEISTIYLQLLARSCPNLRSLNVCHQTYEKIDEKEFLGSMSDFKNLHNLHVHSRIDLGTMQNINLARRRLLNQLDMCSERLASGYCYTEVACYIEQLTQELIHQNVRPGVLTIMRTSGAAGLEDVESIQFDGGFNPYECHHPFEDVVPPSWYGYRIEEDL